MKFEHTSVWNIQIQDFCLAWYKESQLKTSGKFRLRPQTPLELRGCLYMGFIWTQSQVLKQALDNCNVHFIG